MKETSKPELIISNGPRMLPTVTLSNGITYFIDERLGELRNVRDPYDCIRLYQDSIRADDWDEIEKHFGQYTQFITVVCAICKKTLFNGTEEEAKRLIIYCTDCN
jgi:hypothetical protein